MQPHHFDFLPLLCVLVPFLVWFIRANSRKAKRQAALFFLFGLGCWLCYLDYRGWRMRNTHPSILGVIILGGAILGMCGVNIWRHGLLDPQRDPKD